MSAVGVVEGCCRAINSAVGFAASKIYFAMSKNKKKEKSEDLLNPDNVTFIIEKDKLTKAEEDTWF